MKEQLTQKQKEKQNVESLKEVINELSEAVPKLEEHEVQVVLRELRSTKMVLDFIKRKWK